MTKNINSKPFDEATKLKLNLFKESFKEWLPVFINDRYTNQVYIFDFFAGSGKDSEGNYGSPLILLEQGKGNNKQYCKAINKSIQFIFSESKNRKINELTKNLENYIADCKQENECHQCIYRYQIIHSEFKELFNQEKIKHILNDKNIGKFVLLDQYGFKEINDDIFRQMVDFPKTDFIFFISSSFIKRFKEHPNVIKYIDTHKINFDEVKPNECHRTIAGYFRQLIPEGHEHYIHHFTIQQNNKGNYFGLIFGSNHTYGMEKFLKTCWKYDRLSGEANFNIDNNFEKGTLFFTEDTTNKKDEVRNELTKMILSGEIFDNLSGLKQAMKKGCEPGLFTEVVKDLEKRKTITRSGELNFQSTNIHRVPQYFITLAK